LNGAAELNNFFMQIKAVVSNKHFVTQLHLGVVNELLMYNSQKGIVTQLLMHQKKKKKNEASQNIGKNGT
jgi:hypothetical protein